MAIPRDASDQGRSREFFELYWRVVGELALVVEQVEANPPVSASE
jgi:hypothetical protein